jgi:hypothetical protein
LLLNGILYLGFGSNGCNDGNSGWVLSYDKTSLTQLAVFNTSPDYGLASIWQAGTGLAADGAAIYLETAEAGATADVLMAVRLITIVSNAHAESYCCRLFHSVDQRISQFPISIEFNPSS